VAPLPYTETGAKIALYIVIGIFVALEWRIRLRSQLDREGSHPERMSLVMLYLAVIVGVAGGFVLGGTAEGWARASWWSSRGN
jgi:hypothetical protein